MIGSGGSGPTITARASGRARQTSGMMSRIRCSAASALGGKARLPKNRSSAGASFTSAVCSAEKYSESPPSITLISGASGTRARKVARSELEFSAARPTWRSARRSKRRKRNQRHAQLDALPDGQHLVDRQPPLGREHRRVDQVPERRAPELARDVLQRVALPAVEDRGRVRAGERARARVSGGEHLGIAEALVEQRPRRRAACAAWRARTRRCAGRTGSCDANTPRRLGCSRKRSHSSGELGTTPMQCTSVRAASRFSRWNGRGVPASGGIGNTPPITATTDGSVSRSAPDNSASSPRGAANVAATRAPVKSSAGDRFGLDYEAGARP